MIDTNTAAVTEIPTPWIGTATVHEAMGKRGALPAVIRPIDAAMRVWGPAFPVPSVPGDNLALHHALELAPVGSVLMVDAQGYADAGTFGEVMAVAAMARGLRGLVINGAVRDSREIITLGFPVFSVGLCIRGTTKNHHVALPEPIEIAGVRIAAGDLIIGDADGVVAIPRSKALEAVHLSRSRMQQEAGIIARLRQGETSVSIFDLPPALSSISSDKVTPRN